ncbi:hypothetical protein R3P38DRAFT_3311626 [Favolaschia claudopus]|uniref:Integrase core domain-containing protein n=1 Tax=Favolaschia claudopus TaxID=2862362 RepID=A0AAW0CD66_9AGAR
MPPDSSSTLADEPRRRSNQHRPIPPDSELRPLVSFYWNLGFTCPKILDAVMAHFDRDRYGLRRCEEWGMKSTRKTAADWATIEPMFNELRQKFPNMGARSMVQNMRLVYGVKVPEALLNRAFQLVEPDQVARRKRKRFRRKRFWAAGIMDILTFDQHDKWKRFGLWLHVGLDPLPGRLAWLKIWWTNRNPRLITSYYIEACRQLGGIPLITQSDAGPENYGIANCQTVTRQELDNSLIGTLQHRWVNKKGTNVKPEIVWSLLRRYFAPGFQDILERGEYLFDLNNPLHRLLLRWLAIPWLQRELDNWLNTFNWTPRRADKHKVMPHGIPNLMLLNPEQYGTHNYRIEVTPEKFDEMEAKWAPPDDPVFQLVPPLFKSQVERLQLQLGTPEVTGDNLWDVYSQLLTAFESMALEDEFMSAMQGADDHFESSIELLEGQKDLPQGAAAASDDGEEGADSDDGLENNSDEEDGYYDPRQYAEYVDFTDDEAPYDAY